MEKKSCKGWKKARVSEKERPLVLIASLISFFFLFLKPKTFLLYGDYCIVGDRKADEINYRVRSVLSAPHSGPRILGAPGGDWPLGTAWPLAAL